MLIYTDPFEAYEVANSLSPAGYASTIFGGLNVALLSGRYLAIDQNFSILAGTVSDKTLMFYSDTLSQIGTNGEELAIIGAFKDTVNKTANHWASFDFKWGNNPRGVHTKPFAFFGFNDALDTFRWASHAVAPVVTLTQDGLVHVGGNVSASAVVPMSTLVHIDIEVLVSTGQVNVYVGGVLAVSSPPGLSWLASGLVRMGPRCDPWPVSADAAENPMRLSEHFDNLTFYDSTGTTFNSRLTQSVIYTRLPLATQVDANFANTGGAASTMAALSDHTGAVFNTDTYAKSPAADNLADTFTVDTSLIGALDTIKGISIVNLARRNALGNRHIETRVANGASVVDINHTPQTPIGFSTSNQCVVEQAPDGTPWTLSNLAISKFGYVAKAS
jgi:hypothetical protein